MCRPRPGRDALLDGLRAEVDGEWQAHGDPMEAALDAFARRLGIDTDGDRSRHPVALRFPFDPRLRRMSVVVDDGVVVKGAPMASSRCAVTERPPTPAWIP